MFQTVERVTPQNSSFFLVSTPNVEFYDPSNTRFIVLFKLPESGQYTVVAQNEFRIAKSSAYIEVEKGKLFWDLLKTVVDSRGTS